MTRVVRQTKETTIRVEITRDAGTIDVSTTIPFLDHMLSTLARYSGLGVRIAATGDLAHHISEDVAITLGAALAAYLPASACNSGPVPAPPRAAMPDHGASSRVRGCGD